MIALLVCLLSAAVAPASEPVPELARPAGLDAQLVINDVPTRVREWLLDLDLRDSAEFYRRYLGERHVELNSPRGPILAAPHAGRFVTVELSRADDRRTSARVSEAQLSGAARGSSPLPLPAEVTLLGRVSEGTGREAVQTVLARSDSSAQVVGAHLRQSFSRAGLKLLERQPLHHAGVEGEVLNFSDGRRRAEVVLSSDHGRTWIMAIIAGAGT
ncbi:MAG: hypothetical protein JSS24_00340 [Proteobacteria bacterium]|nr:hypothetical protein [Pseudomonadota bacterium]